MKAVNIKESHNALDTMLTGFTNSGKNQTILLGRRLLQQKNDLMKLFDLYYRDPKQNATTRLVEIDGPVAEVFRYNPTDKPRLPIYIKQLIDTAARRSLTVLTNIQVLRRQMTEQGMTPSIAEIRKDKTQLKITGTALLTERGEYVMTLPVRESLLLLILQNHVSNEPSISIPLSGIGDAKDHNEVTINIKSVKRKMKTSRNSGTFQFDMNLRLIVDITSMNFYYDIQKHDAKLGDQIAKELQTQLMSLVQKCQSQKIDPFGFGIYARTYQYPAWKKVEDQWGAAFADAKVQISTHVKINAYGVTQ
ncbi:Ger(x)C family spore germination C-terminal domain-containing protein [Paenibacillus cremeus]|uniref:Ger(X)C family spore germination protein n=1 Tax=Paenibacillus cremeus TaxID=2163881 RepID=A0A559JSR5_9BACL|nr:Ger(x)C family spore germination C-terminal domain-containing protein [Paenibacillus cremeus]TVY02911.1 Ger(x)C family spore germination protein [Paenibacillus cremeus]